MRRVIKVGGSLLLRPDLVEALPSWLEQQSPTQNLVVVGGGELIDAIRHLDQQKPASPAEVHWRCVDLLQHTFEITASWFGEWATFDSPNGQADFMELLDAEQQRGDSPDHHPATLVSVRSFYGPDSGSTLPLTWETTTDSIAAELAIRIDADELVLLKSCRVNSQSVDDLARAGVVDRSLPMIAPSVRSIRIERLP